MLASGGRRRPALGVRVRRRPATRLLVAVGAWLLLMVPGCTYAHEEPGLFPPRETSSATEAPAPPTQTPVPTRAPEPTNPRLPVAGETVWTTAEGLAVQTRIAVHAIRRMPGATVLDWSVTPLRAPGLRRGDAVPSSVNLGLTRETHGDVAVLLVDPGRARVYRPLAHRSLQEFNHCLCSPLWVAQLNLRIGETRLLQVAYPSLPPEVRFIDVSLSTVPPFVHVPVSDIGQAPTARRPTDLARPAAATPSSLPPVEFAYPQGQTRRQSITVDRVVAGPDQTALTWTITSLTDQPGFGLLPLDPPISAALPGRLTAVNQRAVNGPRLRVSGQPDRGLPAQFVTDRFADLGFVECLCTELGLWAASLRDRGGRVTVNTTYPALPAGTEYVDVLLGGAKRLSHVGVTRAADSAPRMGPPAAAAPKPGWTYADDRPPRGWPTSDWPTALPDPGQLRSYAATVDDLVDVRR